MRGINHSLTIKISRELRLIGKDKAIKITEFTANGITGYQFSDMDERVCYDISNFCCD